MKAPSPPKPPDPYETSAAQQLANVEVAKANTHLQNANEIRPDGTVTYTYDATDTISAYTYDADGNITNTQTIPRVIKTVELTTKGQLQFEQQENIAIALNNWALGQIGVLAVQQAYPVDPATLTGRDIVPQAANITTGAPVVGDIVATIGSADTVAHHNAVRDAIDSRIQYQITIDRNARIAQLAVQGLVPGMEAYDRDVYAFDKQSTDARLQAYITAGQEQTRIVQTEGMIGDFQNRATELTFQLTAARGDLENARELQRYQALAMRTEFVNTFRQQELQEQIAIRSQNLNEVSALMHGGQVQVPQFQQFRAGMVDRTPVAESVYKTADLKMQAWQTQVQSQQAMFGALLGFAGNLGGGLIGLSDVTTKTDIRQIASDLAGYGWYEYRYIWDHPGMVRYGVMAQEVERVKPSAVKRWWGKIKGVAYGMLR